MRKRSGARFANGIISALIVAFFAVHSFLGGLEALVSLPSPAPWIMWVGVGIVAVHVVTSVVTSYQQLSDAEFPPSTRKKRHLALKWVTGGLLAIAAGAHIVCVQTFGPDAVQVNVSVMVVVLLLVVVLCVHVWVGAKSLVTDLEQDKGLVRPFRACVCVFALVAVCLVVAGFVR